MRGRRWGHGLAVAVLCLILVARVSSVASAGQDGQLPFTVALFVIPLLYAIPWTRRPLSRHRWLALAAQAVLTWLPFALFGSSWQVGIGGLLAGLVLLMVPGRLSWLLAAGLLAAELVVRATLTGWPISPPWYSVIYVAAYYIDDALEFFALVRLAQIVEEVADARERTAEIAVVRERLEAARSLQAAVGERLAGIAAAATAARQTLSRDAAQARTQIAAAGAAARNAVAQARQVTARQGDAPRPDPAWPAPGRAVIGARLAWAVLVVVLSAFAVEGAGYTVWAHYSARLMAVVVGVILLSTALQLYHSRMARNGHRPRAWPLTLGLQAVLAYAFVFPFIRVYSGALGPLLAGAMLLLIPGRWRWAGFAAVVASYSVLYAELLPVSANEGSQLIPNIVFIAAVSSGLGLVVYGLSRLADLAAQLETLNGELARMAVVRERLRIARDVHDLLGLGLSAIALKTDLIGRLIGRDDTRALAELAEMGRICGSARAEVRRVTGDGQQLSLASELEATRQILTSAGVSVCADMPPGPLPETADTVLAPVLREAATNVLRHSTAKACTVQATISGGTLRLRVSNDGATASQPADDTVAWAGPSRGLANLTARVHAAGGRFTSGHEDGWFHVTAELPGPDAACAPQSAAQRRL